ncbi:hypothetical protein KXS11_11985 [Plantibacter flavus]|uniref:hypothetical protein n=1 Tax=Plantibacter flavus TaxID=150123 RepID=UPI003F1731C7
MIAATAVVVGAWIVGASWSLTQLVTPEVPVRAYLASLADGDVEQAARLDGTAAAAEEQGYRLDLLTNTSYALASEQATGYRIRGTEVRDSGAVVTVDYEQRDERQTMELELARRENVFLWFNAWRLTPSGMPTVSVATDRFGALELSYAGTSLGTIEEDTTFLIAPGTYELQVDSPTGSFEFVAPEVDAAWGAKRNLFLYPTLTSLGVEQASAAVTAYVDACIASTSYEPSGCSFAIDNSAGDELTSVSWALTQAPEFTFDSYSEESGFMVTTTKRGSADFLAEYRLTTGETGIATAEDCEVWVDGSVRLDAAGVWVFTPYSG